MPLMKTLPASSSRANRAISDVVARPRRGAKAEARIVRERDRVVEIARANDRGDRAERLFAERRRVARHVVEHRRLVEEARSRRAACRRAARRAPIATDRLT